MERGERRKRKMNSQEEEEDDEDEKMEKFFALIKSTREVRELLRNTNSNESKQEQIQERKFDIVLGQKPTGIWNPSFQPEDFLGDIDNYNNYINNIPAGGGVGTEAGPSKREDHDQEDNNKRVDEEKDNKEGNDLELDLKLSL
ncbi:uncharacterized protein LOC125421095 [Ziziphus jujuba]|uniref:Uncharacterized protein LOC125421095 n=1 Tax=Ziziphus jujuba TaxID=326968 RepID=A0ABM3IB40_ZIZJJ|nr:uncharacterized protein LOC125421095 [Ziziphus jujuba]